MFKAMCTIFAAAIIIASNPIEVKAATADVTVNATIKPLGKVKLSKDRIAEVVSRILIYKAKGKGTVITYKSGKYVRVKPNKAALSWYNKNRRRKLTPALIYIEYMQEVKKATTPYSKAPRLLTGNKFAPSLTKINVGDKPLEFKAIYNGTRVLKGTWGVEDSNIGSITEDGKFTALNEGETNIQFNYTDVKQEQKTLIARVKVSIPINSIRFKDTESNKYTRELLVSTNSNFSPGIIIKPKKSAVRVNKGLTINEDNIEFTAYLDEKLKKEIDLYDNDYIMEESPRTFTTLSDEVTVYLRAKYNGKNIKGNVLKVRIVDKDRLEKEKEKQREEEEKRKQSEEQKKQDAEKKKQEDEQKAKEAIEKSKEAAAKAMPNRIAIDSNAILNSDSSTASNSVKYATIFFRVYDGNDKEVTSQSYLNMSNTKIKFKRSGDNSNFEQDLQINGSGKILLPIYGNLTNPLVGYNPIGYSGTLTIEYTKIDGNKVKAEASVVVMPQAKIARADVIGIYKAGYTLNSYEEVLSRNVSKLKKDDVINGFGGSELVNNLPNSYYILLDAYDTNNARVTRSGVNISELNLAISGNSSIQLDSAFINGQNQTASIKPISINGREYLTYPLKAATVAEGVVNISITGVPVFTKAIGDGSTIVTFAITQNNARANVDNIIPFVLSTTSGTVTDFDKVVSYLGLTVGIGQDIVPLYDTSIIQSTKGSVFSIRKKSDGSAELHYQPSPAVLINTSGLLETSGIDYITVFKGKGTPLEQNFQIYVTAN